MTSKTQDGAEYLQFKGANGSVDHGKQLENGHQNDLGPVNGRKDEMEIVCGPLLNYKGMRDAGLEASLWRGSVLIVTKPSRQQPQLKAQCKGPWHGRHESTGGQSELSTTTAPTFSHERNIAGVKIYEDPGKTFWRFAVELPIQEHEACWTYSIASSHFYSSGKPRSSSVYTFAVPSISQSMRMMFHSCNGFSIGTDEDAWSGTALWNDVLRSHKQAPFHVMVGGGDQIYNDAVRVTGPLKAWTDIANPKKRRDYPFDEALRAACDSFYFENYADWYAAEPFASANSQIPQVNIWDDHGMCN